MNKKSISPRAESRRHAPTSAFELMRANMDNFFHRAWGHGPVEEGRAIATFIPSVQTSETKHKIKVSVELPGMTENDVDIALSPDGGTLTLSGEKHFEEESEDEDHHFYHFERSYGSFRRQVPLPSPVDADRVKAKFKHGLLKITMHKKEDRPDLESHQIQIEV